MLWPGAPPLCAHLLTRARELRGVRALELGSGSGAAAIFAAALYICVTVIELISMRNMMDAREECDLGNKPSCTKLDKYLANTPQWKLKLANIR